MVFFEVLSRLKLRQIFNEVYMFLAVVPVSDVIRVRTGKLLHVPIFSYCLFVCKRRFLNESFVFRNVCTLILNLEPLSALHFSGERGERAERMAGGRADMSSLVQN